MGASDVHIEPHEKNFKVRLRIDGIMKDYLKLDKLEYSSLVSRIKVICNMDIDKKRIPQDGNINIFELNCDIRVSTLPTIFGEKVVLRILVKDKIKFDLKTLGYTDVKKIKNIIKRPYGIFLITGPTGSGKSSTLYSILKELNHGETNIVTLENPVEYVIENVNQVNINSKINLNYSNVFRNVLRQDPDIIMVGEIRDEETALLAITAAITGHLVFATLHTNDSHGAIIRLINMGVPRYLLSDALIGVVSQRLVRKLCDKCSTSRKATKNEAEFLGKDSANIKQNNGCAQCDGGYKGRVIVSEVLEMDEKLRALIISFKGKEELIKYSNANNFKTLIEDCKYGVLAGITTMEEYMKINCNEY